MPDSEPRPTQRATSSVPPGAVVPPRDRGAAVALRPSHLYKAVGLFFFLALLYRYFEPISQVLLLAYAAVILAVAFNVVVSVVPLERRWVTAALGLAIVTALGLGLRFGIPALAHELRGFAAQMPRFQQELQEWGNWIQEQTGLDIPLFGSGAREAFGDFFRMRGADVVGQARGVLEMLLLPLLILFGALYAVGKPNEQLLSPLLRLAPRDYRLAFRRVFELLGARLRGWVKGTLLAMLFVGLLSIGAFYLLGIEYALILGIISGITEFIPILGPWIGGFAAILVALLNSPDQVVWVMLIVLAIQQVEGNLITPLVMSRAAEVHPFVTLFALLLFGTVFGFLGLLLALPLVLLFWTFVEVLWVERAIDTDQDSIAPVVKE